MKTLKKFSTDSNGMKAFIDKLDKESVDFI